MAKKKNYEFQSRDRDYGRNSEGLKQRRLKDESRWKFNPNAGYEDEVDDLSDVEFDDDYDQNSYSTR